MWATVLDSSKRHCWGPNNSGEYTIDGTYPAEICTDYKSHPKRAGKVEWMRFIHNTPRGIFTDLPEGGLVLSNDTTHDGRWVYCENYNNRIKIFLDQINEIAIVEVHDPSLTDAVNEALNATKAEYENDFR